MIFRVASLARARAGFIARRNASSQVTTTSSTSALNSLARNWYNVFGSSTVAYAAFLTVGVIAAELATNGLTDMLWEMNNSGKTYAQVDWSKFDPPDDDDEDEEEDGDDDDDDDDDDDE